MSSYDVINGDTYELIARKVYGDDQQAAKIRRANPGVVEPLAPGVTLFIPPDPTLPKRTPLSTGEPEEVELLIENVRFRFWDGLAIRRSMTSPSSIGFESPFDPNDAQQRELFRPFSFKPVEILVGGNRLFSGTMLTPVPDVSAERRTVSIQCYSIPGVIFDCTAPGSALPLEFDDQTVNQIAKSLCEHFGIGVEERSGAGPKFERVALEPEKKIGDFLTDLAKQRGQIMSDTPDGKLLLWTSIAPGSPVAVLEESEAPVVSVKPVYKPQGYYSDITGLSPVSLTSDGEKYSVRNKFAGEFFRPWTFESKDTEQGNLKKSAEAKLGRMFGDVVTYELELNTWRDPEGELWTPNTTLLLQAPGAMIYEPYEFLIKSVILTRQAKAEKAKLELVMPGAFSGEQPEALPWG